MSDSSKPAAGDPNIKIVQDAAATTAKAADAAKKAGAQQNPALRAMGGLPRFRLPSRNWMIFLSVTGSITAGIQYDRWQTRKVKEKWCKLVSHIADEPLNTTSLPRTLTVYLSAPPGDGLRSAREHFHNYVKPILVAAAINWNVIEGRKEGDVRYKTAEKIRRKRRLEGEGTPLPPEDHTIEDVRKNMGVTEFEGVAGDLVIGRHTWKEYLRGMHEGWLGPVDTPSHVDIAMGTVPETDPASPVSDPSTSTSNNTTASIAVDDPVTPLADLVPDEAATSEMATKDKPADEEEEKPKPRQPPPYITPDAYTTALTSRNLPSILEPSAPISCPHILGFRNTPIRMYRYFTQRRLADTIGRQVASAILASNRPYNVVTATDDNSPGDVTTTRLEQMDVLIGEEKDWWKTVRQPRKEHEESVLIEPIILDERLTSRMRKFELTQHDEEQAKAIAIGSLGSA